MNELDGLQTIGVNSRRGDQNFDLFHDVEKNSITISDAMYSSLNMNDNGFTAHVGNGNIYLSVQSNDDSVSYKGRVGYEKGKTFTSTVTSQLLEKAGLVGGINMVEVGPKDGAMYYRLELAQQGSSTEEVDELVDAADDVVNEEAETQTEELV